MPLCETERLLRSMLGQDEASLAWLDALPPQSPRCRGRLLRRLYAVDEQDEITALGRTLLSPVHPRIGRFAPALCQRGFHDEAATLSALVIHLVAPNQRP